MERGRLDTKQVKELELPNFERTVKKTLKRPEIEKLKKQTGQKHEEPKKIEDIEKAKVEEAHYTTEKELEEVFILPVGLKVVATLDKQPLFGSPKVTEKYLKALSKSKRTKHVVPKIERLIAKGHLIPCLFTKGFVGFLAWKIFSPAGVKSIMGFYTNMTKKVYIIIDNNVNMFGYVSNNFLGMLTSHELCHMYADTYRTAFVPAFKKELGTFYQYYWSEIFNIKKDKIPMNVVIELVTDLFKISELSKSRDPSRIRAWLIKVNKTLQPLSSDKEAFVEMIGKYYLAVAKFNEGIDRFFTVRNELSGLLNPLYQTYKHALKVRNLNTIAVQELLYPSEVVAIYSEKDKGVISKIV